MQKTLEVVDDFFRRPNAVREAALAGDWAPASGRAKIHSTSAAPLLDEAEVVARIRRILGSPDASPPEMISGHFVHIGEAAGDELEPHVDTADWAAVIDLTPPELCLGGTSFYDRPAGHGDGDGLRETMHVPMAFNRMVLFRASAVPHRVTRGFGTGPADGRLSRVFLFRIGNQ